MNAPAGLLVSLESLVETHDRPFVVIDQEHRIVACNQAFERAFGRSREGLVGQLCHRLLHDSQVPCEQLGEHCPFCRAAAGDPLPTALHSHLDGRGRLGWVQVKGFALRGSDGRLYVGEQFEPLPAGSRQAAEEVGLVGSAPAFREAVERLTRAARAATPVLLQGETGTGKTLAAAFLHRQSPRRDAPFIVVDCAALPEPLFESEMFGHERGAFTGSVGSRRGLFELADGGTLLLDEIGEVPAGLQAKLLRVLDTGEFRRLGGRRMHRADVNVICATNRPLGESVRNGRFRSDLYYRIAGFTVSLPPLRERREDVPLLAEAFLARLRESRRQPFRLTEAAARLLCRYDYPGNVRELRNILEVAAACADAGLIGPEHLAAALPGAWPEGFRDDTALPGPAPGTPGDPPAQGPASDPAPAAAGASLRELEERYIRRLLEQYHGHRRKVADTMGVSERTLYRKLRRYSLT